MGGKLTTLDLRQFDEEPLPVYAPYHELHKPPPPLSRCFMDIVPHSKLTGRQDVTLQPLGQRPNQTAMGI